MSVGLVAPASLEAAAAAAEEGGAGLVVAVVAMRGKGREQDTSTLAEVMTGTWMWHNTVEAS